MKIDYFLDFQCFRLNLIANCWETLGHRIDIQNFDFKNKNSNFPSEISVIERKV